MVSVLEVARAADRLAKSVVMTPMDPDPDFSKLSADPASEVIVEYVGLAALQLRPLIVINESLFRAWYEEERKRGGGIFFDAVRRRDYSGLKLWGYPVRVVLCDFNAPPAYEIHVTTESSWRYRDGRS